MDTNNSRSLKYAAARARQLEGARARFHVDRGGTDTIGLGYTPIVWIAPGRWGVQRSMPADFASAGISLTPAQDKALEIIAIERSNPDGEDPAKLSRAREALESVTLTAEQQEKLFAVTYRRAEADARRFLGADVFGALDPKRQAELALAAYQSPRALRNAAPDLVRHIKSGDFDAAAGRLARMGEALDDPARYRGAAAIFRDPELKGGAMIARGDTLSGIAERTGHTIAEILTVNPQITDPNKIRAGDVLRLPARKQPSAGPEPEDHPTRTPARQNPETAGQASASAPATPLPSARPASEPQPSPVAKAALERMNALGASPAEFMSKPLSGITKPEITALIGHPDYWNSVGQRLRPAPRSMPDFAQGWFARAYDHPAGAAPRVPRTSSSARMADGHALSHGLAQVAGAIGQGIRETTARVDLTKPVKALQTALNGVAGNGFARPLKVDGVLGPKTNDRVRDVLTYQGTAPLLARLNALGAKS